MIYNVSSGTLNSTIPYHPRGQDDILNVTDVDKIKLVSSQAVLEVSSFSMDTRWKSSLPLVSSLARQKSTFQDHTDIDEPPFQFIHTIGLSVVGTTLHDSPDFVILRIEIWADLGHSLVAINSGIS